MTIRKTATVQNIMIKSCRMLKRCVKLSLSPSWSVRAICARGGQAGADGSVKHEGNFVGRCSCNRTGLFGAGKWCGAIIPGPTIFNQYSADDVSATECGLFVLWAEAEVAAV